MYVFMDSHQTPDSITAPDEVHLSSKNADIYLTSACKHVVGTH